MKLFVLGLCVAAALAAPMPDDDDEDHQQQQDNRRRLHSLSLKLVDDRDDDDDDRRNRIRDVNDRRDVRIRDRIDDVDDDSLRNSNLDLLTKELDQLASRYRGRGKPPLVRNVPGSRVHNLGYTPNEGGSYRPQSDRDIVASIPKPERIPVIQSMYAPPLQRLPIKSKISQSSKHRDRDQDRDRVDLRDRDDDDDEYDRK